MQLAAKKVRITSVDKLFQNNLHISNKKVQLVIEIFINIYHYLSTFIIIIKINFMWECIIDDKNIYKNLSKVRSD